MFILGLTHPVLDNSTAVLIEDGKIIAVGEEERFVRKKHAPKVIPINGIDFILKYAKINYDDIEHIAIGWSGPHKEDEINEYSRNAMLRGWITQFEKKVWFESFGKEKMLINFLNKRFPKAKISFVRHHLAHAASACYVGGFEKSLFITLDGRGELESGIMGIYDGGEFEIIRSLDLDESLGTLYGNFTELCGFREHWEEGKTMGLAPYGRPIKSLLDIVKIKKESKILIDWDRIYSLIRNKKFDGKDPTKDIRKDYASTAQYLLEKCVLFLVSELKVNFDIDRICLSGGSALNIDMNGRLLSEGLVNNIFVQPASHDAGVALGAALIVHHENSSIKPQSMVHTYLGVEEHGEEVEKFLKKSNIKYQKLEDTPGEIAELLSNNNIIGWMQGRAEYGPRALGARSILANPSDPKMWKIVNRIKGREYWRPLAPSIVEEHLGKFFENYNVKTPYMLLRFLVKENKVQEIPSVVHVDGSSRPHSVSKVTNNLYWNLLNEFRKKNGCPILLNTSLNLAGEPLVNSTQDALNTLKNSEIDYLCIDNFLIQNRNFSNIKNS